MADKDLLISGVSGSSTWAVHMPTPSQDDGYGSVAIEVSPQPYAVPAQEVEAQVALAETAIQQGDADGARKAVGALQLYPATINSFQETYPEIWRDRVQPLLLTIAADLHWHPPKGQWRYGHIYAPQAKEFLKTYVVVATSENGTTRHYTYRKEPLERGLQPQTGLCNPQWVRFPKGKPGPAKEQFLPAGVWKELEGELLNHVHPTNRDPNAFPCYQLTTFAGASLQLAGQDQTVGEAEEVALQATVAASGYALMATQWEQKFGPPVKLAQQNGLWKLTAPRVLADGVKLGFTISATNVLGHTVADDVVITVNNTINEPPTLKVQGPKAATGGSVLTLIAKGHDPNPADTGKLTYSWQQVSGPVVATVPTPDGTQLTFTAPTVAQPTAFKFKVQVNDPNGGEATRTHTVKINPAPQAASSPTVVDGLKAAIKNDLSRLQKAHAGNPDVLKKLAALGELGPVQWVPETKLGPGASLLDRIKAVIHEAQPVERLEVCLVVDQSGSMSDNIQQIRAGWADVSAELAAASPDSAVCLVSFRDNDIVVRVPLEQTSTAAIPGALKKVISQIGGQLEYIAEAADMALTEMAKNGQPGATRKMIILTDEKGDFRPGKATMAGVKAKAAQLGATIQTVFIDEGGDIYLDEASTRESLMDYMTVAKVPYAIWSMNERTQWLLLNLENRQLDRQVRFGVIYELGRIGTGNPLKEVIVERLFKSFDGALLGGDVLAREVHLAAFGKIGGKAIVAGLVTRIKTPRENTSENNWVKNTIGLIGYLQLLVKSDPASAVPTLLEALRTAPRWQCDDIVKLLLSHAKAEVMAILQARLGDAAALMTAKPNELLSQYAILHVSEAMKLLDGASSSSPVNTQPSYHVLHKDLESSNLDFVNDACLKIRQFGLSHLTPALIAQLKKQPAGTDKIYALITTLGAVADTWDAVPVLTEFLDDPSPGIAFAAAEAIQAIEARLAAKGLE